ncbi:Glycine cleavage system transcriptional antiactivator GcvR [hydrothermal vent metagenome]|uniref:Glycine cleavage system transcriptional antiactivator GcvR n=1 Tax=hydrothermal vent metagenome TaxID=652676 RepID=A0A3B0WVG2_9ZZZZ
MTTSLVITAIGADRPGIVNDLTEILLKADLNIEDSRMAVLGGEFAVMLLITGSDQSINTITQQKEALENALNLNLLIKSTQRVNNNDNSMSESHYNILVEGMDNPGIVHKLTRYLSQQHINIINMQTDSGHAPHTGTPVFAVNIKVDIPAKQDIEQITNDFTKLCDELNMDVKFNPI